MNIFFLSNDPVEAAQLQCNKHVLKMPTESAQMLSTVHRVCDGYAATRITEKGRKLTYYHHPELDDVLYKTVHVNHPSTIWTRATRANYLWHYQHFVALCDEFEFRYGKPHGSFLKLNEILKNPPKNIPDSPLTTFALAMKSNPECQFPEDPVKSYRLFYQTKQHRFKMIWKKRDAPQWFKYVEKQE